MVRIPLDIRYRFNREKQVYEKVNSHKTLTIAEYEALGKREDESLRAGAIWALAIFTAALVVGALI